jgi:nitronate monooxygenase
MPTTPPLVPSPSITAAALPATCYTEAFGSTWPDAPHRVLRSSIAAAEAHLEDIVGEMTSLDGRKLPVVRWGSHTPSRATTGAIEAMSLWAGESVGAVRRVQPAAEIVRELAEEAERLLARRG